MKIIVAEDEQRMRQGLVRLIDKLGEKYEVVAQASNGQMAESLILEMEPDVAILDIKMPFKSGIEVMRTVRARGVKTEFVVVSAYADFDLAQQSIALGVAGYLLKPPTEEELGQVLKKIGARMEGMKAYGIQSELKDQYPDVHPLIRKALGIIEHGYAGKISQKQLADELALSPEYFSYLFTKNIGKSFSVFLREYRIEKAKEIYRSGSYDKREVPYKVGFSDAKYFGKVFREVAGMSPTEYIAQL